MSCGTPLNAIIGLTEMMVKNAARFGTEKAHFGNPKRDTSDEAAASVSLLRFPQRQKK